MNEEAQMIIIYGIAVLSAIGIGLLALALAFDR